jgi:hypothetical protein
MFLLLLLPFSFSIVSIIPENVNKIGKAMLTLAPWETLQNLMSRLRTAFAAVTCIFQLKKFSLKMSSKIGKAIHTLVLGQHYINDFCELRQ